MLAYVRQRVKFPWDLYQVNKTYKLKRSIYLSICLSVCLFIYLSIYLPFIRHLFASITIIDDSIPHLPPFRILSLDSLHISQIFLKCVKTFHTNKYFWPRTKSLIFKIHSQWTLVYLIVLAVTLAATVFIIWQREHFLTWIHFRCCEL